MEQRAEDAALLVVLFEEFFTDAALLGCQVENLLVVVFGIEVHCQHTGDVVTAATQLTAYTDDDMFVVVHPFLLFIVFYLFHIPP